jgi:hypothetical protein
MAVGLFTGLFDTAREGFLVAEINWEDSNIRAALVRNWTPDRAVNKFVSEITGTLAANALLSNKTWAAGVAGNSVPITWQDVPASAVAHYIVIYQSSLVGQGTDTTAGNQRLIAFIDSNGANGLPVQPNNNDITWTPDTGPNKIFKL